MLRHFEHEALALVLGFQRVQDLREPAVELHVDDRADDLGDVSDLVCCSHCFLVSALTQSASAPEMISISSLVIMAWRVRL